MKVSDPNKAKALKDMMNKVNKKFGDEAIVVASENMEKFKKAVIPTASLVLNKLLYCGGINGIVEWYGQSGSGKTSAAIETIAVNQQRDPDFVAAWLETEGSITEDILKTHGVDLDRLVFIDQASVDNAENALDVTRSVIESASVNLLVVNSVAGLCPKTENESDLEKANIALTARLLSKYFRVITGPVDKNKMTVIMINQIRQNVGAMFGPSETTGGGLALGFYANQRVRFNKIKIAASDPIKDEEGLKISYIIKKNRLAGAHNPMTKGECFARYETGIDNEISLPDLLLEAGIVRNKGAYWYYEDENGNPIVIDGVECKFKSRGEFVKALKSNDVLKNTFYALVADADIKGEDLSEEEVKDSLKEEEYITNAMTQIFADDDAAAEE